MRSDDWLDISTAPKNPEGKFHGPTIMVWCTADNLPWPAYWAQGGPDNAGCWVVCDQQSQPDNEIWPDDVTHWQAIAKPWPAPAKEPTP